MTTKCKTTRMMHVASQVSLVFIYLWLILYLLDQASTSRIVWAVGASSLASSAFIVFMSPKSSAADPLHIFWGYVVCIFCGIFFHYLIGVINHCLPGHGLHVYEFFTAVGIGLAIVLMVLLRVSHPPGVGMTVVLILERWGFDLLIVIVFAFIVLIFLRAWFKDYLIKLT